MRKRRNILTARANFLAWLSETLFLVLLIPGSLNDSQVCVWQYRHLSGGSLPMQWNFWLMVGYTWKPLPSANGCVSNIVDHSIAPISYHSLWLLMLQVIYLTLTSCSFPILYYTSIESNMERMWITVEHLASLGAKIFKKSADWVSVLDWMQNPRKTDFDRTIWIFVFHILGYQFFHSEILWSEDRKEFHKMKSLNETHKLNVQMLFH